MSDHSASIRWLKSVISHYLILSVLSGLSLLPIFMMEERVSLKK